MLPFFVTGFTFVVGLFEPGLAALSAGFLLGLAATRFSPNYSLT